MDGWRVNGRVMNAYWLLLLFYYCNISTIILVHDPSILSEKSSINTYKTSIRAWSSEIYGNGPNGQCVGMWKIPILDECLLRAHINSNMKTILNDEK